MHARIGTGARERIVVGAHYDVFGDLPGADDNASGVAALLAVAQRLAKRPLAADVELVAYALEEMPHYRTDAMGSVRHARALRAAGVRVRAMLSLEMLGYYDDAPGSQEFESAVLRERFGDRGNFVAVVGRAEEAALLAAIEPAMRAASDLPVAFLAAPKGDAGHRPLRPPELLEGRLPRAPGHRHGLPAQSALPPGHRPARDARLRAPGEGRPRGRGGGRGPGGALARRNACGPTVRSVKFLVGPTDRST